MNAEELKRVRAGGYSDDEIRAHLLSKGEELPDELKVSQAKASGVQLPTYAKFGLTALQGPTLGFGEEITSAVGAPFAREPGETYTQAYKRLRDIQRGAIESYKKEYPIGAPVTQGVASLPLGALRLGTGIKGAAMTGGVTGAISGAGEAESTEDIGAEALMSALSGTALGGGVETLRSKVIAPVAGSVKSRVTGVLPKAAQDFANMSSTDYARRRVAEQMLLDGATTEQVTARLAKLGDDAILAEAAGRNMFDLLDTMATLPGRTKNYTEQLIRQRQATRGRRLGESAQRELAQGQPDLGDLVESLVKKRSVDATPLYEQVKTMTVALDKDLSDILNAARKLGAFSKADRIATAEQKPFTLSRVDEGGIASMTDLDLVKQGLDQISKSGEALSKTGEVTPFGRSIIELKNKLLKRLDEETIDPNTGKSVYAAARSAFAGTSRMIDAAEFGRTVLNKTPDQIRQELRTMGDSEREAFQVGAYEGLRMLAGTQAGQSKLLNLWKEPAMQERLKEIFPSERSFRRFASDVAAEARKREIQSIGRGSQTAGREARMEELAASQLQDTVNLAAAAKSMDVGSLLNLLRSGYRRTSIPQPVRDEIGRILMSRATSADEIRALRSAMEKIKQQERFMATTSGVMGGQATQPFVDVLKSLLD